MKKLNNIVAILSVISVCFTIFSPMANKSALFGDYSETVSLFSGLDSELCVILTMLASAGLVLFSILYLLIVKNATTMMGMRVFSILLLMMQGVCAVVCMRGYDDNTFFGALANSVTSISLNPLFVVTMVLTLATVITSFYAQPDSTSEDTLPVENNSQIN